MTDHLSVETDNAPPVSPAIAPISPTVPYPSQSPASPALEGSPGPESNKPKIDPNKDLWQNIAVNVKEAVGEQVEQTVVLCGARNSGKTSIIYRMLSLSQSVKATTALEYYYGKREERNTTQIAHFWELAQGTELSQLLDIVMLPENIHTAVATVVVDAADPGTAWENSQFWLKRIDDRAQEIFQKMNAKKSTTPDKMIGRAKKNIGLDHPDLAKLHISGIPTVLIVNKIDAYKGDAVKFKLLVRTMRFLAHIYGASLLFTSEQEREAIKLRALLSQLIFHIPFDEKHLQFDAEKGGVLIPAGKDSFVDIGEPSPVTPHSFVPCGDAHLDKWKAPMDDAFPPKNTRLAANEVEFLQQLYDADGAAEPAIDAMRKQKDEELAQYRRNVAKRAADAKAGQEQLKE